MHKLERRCAWVAMATIAVMLLMMAAACAEPIASKMTTPPQGDRPQAIARAQSALDASGVMAKLKSFGLNEQQVKQRLAQLSADELNQLTTGAEVLAAGGAEPSLSTTTWLLIILIVLILAT